MTWISVNDELPESNTKVMVVVSGNNIVRFQAFALLTNYSNKPEWLLENLSYALSKYVTH